MSDLVERLRRTELCYGNGERAALGKEAASELARLKGEVERLRIDWRNSEDTRQAHERVIATLRASNERMRAALTPSAETKAAYMGEFHFEEECYDEEGDLYVRKVAVPWTTVKEIMAAILARAALQETRDAD